MTTFTLNGRTVSVNSPDDAPLLWVIAMSLVSQEPNSAAGLDCVAPAPCMWKGAPMAVAELLAVAGTAVRLDLDFVADHAQLPATVHCKHGWMDDGGKLAVNHGWYMD